MARVTAMASIRDLLTKLTVGTGGKHSCAKIDNEFELCFREDREGREVERPYALDLRYQDPASKRRQEKTIFFQRTDVFTKSKSMWARNNVWRLTPAKVDELAPQIERVIENTRKKREG